MFTTGDIIDLAVRIEKNGESFYRSALERVSDPDFRSALEWLAEEERRHGEWLEDLRRELDAAVRTASPGPGDGGSLEEVLGDQRFSLQEVDVSGIRTVDELLHLALEFERDTMVFYEMLGAFLTDDPSRSLVSRILAEEQTHVAALEKSLKPEKASSPT